MQIVMAVVMKMEGCTHFLMVFLFFLLIFFFIETCEKYIQRMEN